MVIYIDYNEQKDGFILSFGPYTSTTTSITIHTEHTLTCLTSTETAAAGAREASQVFFNKIFEVSSEQTTNTPQRVRRWFRIKNTLALWKIFLFSLRRLRYQNWLANRYSLSRRRCHFHHHQIPSLSQTCGGLKNISLF